MCLSRLIIYVVSDLSFLCRQELYRMELLDPGAKAIVFSQFVNMLDVSSWYSRLIILFLLTVVAIGVPNSERWLQLC